MEDTAAHLHFPAGLACEDPVLFWSLARALAKAGLRTDLDSLIKCDWSELIKNEDAESLAGELAQALFERDDLARLQYISEGFDPSVHTAYFQRLRRAARAALHGESKECLGWLVSQGLLGKGLDGFRQALWDGRLEVAKSLHQPTPAEAEALFYERPEALNKESASYLCFACPQLISWRALAHAIERRSSEEVALYLCWKMESSLNKAELRHPGGDEAKSIAMLCGALSRGYGSVAKKLIEWSPALAFDKLAPHELSPPWDNDPNPIKLEGAMSLTASDWATLYAHETLGRCLKSVNASEPNLAKIKALILGLSQFLDGRRPGAGPVWASTRSLACEQFAKRFWG